MRKIIRMSYANHDMAHMMTRSHYFCRRTAMASMLLTAFLCLSACARTPESLKRPDMTPLSARLQPLFEKTRTVCFSRFVLDVPATATVVYGPAAAGAGSIRYYSGEGGKVTQHVTEHLAEVEKDRRLLDEDALAKFPMSGKVIDGAVSGQKLVFGSVDHITYSIQSFIPLGDDLFVQSAGGAMHKDETIASLNRDAANLRLRHENEVPVAPGLCIEGGLLSIDAEFENVALGIRLKEFPDVHFSIEVLKNQAFLIESSDLEQRMKDSEKDRNSWRSRVKFFRRGPRQLGDWKGYEVLAHKPPQGESTDSHEFHFHSLGTINDPLRPDLDIQLDTGVKDDSTASVKPSLTDEEAVALWDKLAASIRVRPTSVKASAVERGLAVREVVGLSDPTTTWDP